MLNTFSCAYWPFLFFNLFAKVGLLVSLLLSCMSSLYILDTSVFFQMCISHTPSSLLLAS